MCAQKVPKLSMKNHCTKAIKQYTTLYKCVLKKWVLKLSINDDCTQDIQQKTIYNIQQYRNVRSKSECWNRAFKDIKQYIKMRSKSECTIWVLMMIVYKT